MYEEQCPCGSSFPVIEVEGRQGEVLHFETDEGTEIPIFPLALTSVVKQVPGVHRSQLVKTGEKTLELRLSVEASATDRGAVWAEVERAVTDFFAAQGVDIAIEQAAEEPARDPQSNKFRHVWSAV